MKKEEFMGTLNKNKPTSSWIEFPLIEWILTEGKIWMWSILALALIGLFFLIRWMSGPATGINDYLQTQTDVISLVQMAKEENPEEKRASILTNLKANLKKHPELHARYDGIIAQTLLIQNVPQEVDQFEKSALNELKTEDLINYQEFAGTSLLISKQQYQDALKRALALKDAIIKQKEKNPLQRDDLSFGTILFAFNLLRVAILQNQLGSNEGEKEAWQEWQKYANGTDQFSQEAFKTVSSLFEEGKVNLATFIKGTEK